MTIPATTAAASLAAARGAYLRADSRASKARDLAQTFPGFGTIEAQAADLTLKARTAYAEYRRLLALTSAA
jgi:hypothetical protein